MPRAPGVVVVLATCPTAASARRLSRVLVAGRHAACVTAVPGAASTYRWAGRIERAREHLLLIKTTRRQVDRLRTALVAAHPYKMPELLVLQVVAGYPPYLRWVAQAVGAATTARRS